MVTPEANPMMYFPPVRLAIGIAWLALSAGSPVFAAEDPLPALPSEEALCGPCEKRSADLAKCKKLYVGFSHDGVSYEGFLNNEAKPHPTRLLEALQKWVNLPPELKPSDSCGACLPATLALKLLAPEQASILAESHAAICNAAKEVIEPCDQVNHRVFESLTTRYPRSLPRFKGADASACIQVATSGPPRQPLPQGLPGTRSLATKLLLGFGVPVTLLGIGLLGAAAAKGTALAAPVGAMTGCAYKGFDTPCFDPGPAIGLGITGSILTAGGVVLIGLGAHRAIVETRPPATPVAKETP